MTHSANTILYNDQGSVLEGLVVYPDQKIRPAVILCHTWKGKDEFICEKAKEIASLGYIAFALDMYGMGIEGKNMEESLALKKPFMEDRFFLQRRVLKAFETVCHLPLVDTNRIAALGFGFGGTCALDLARSGVDLKAAISIYGHLTAPHFPQKKIPSKILIHHGGSDPIITNEELQSFQQEMTEAQVDWQAHIYGNTLHAFASPNAHAPHAGILYNPISASRAWKISQLFLEEVFN